MSKESFALKQLLCQSNEQIEDAHSELRALKAFANHPNIVRLVEHASTANKSGAQRNILRHVYLLFPFYQTGTCWDLIRCSSSHQ